MNLNGGCDLKITTSRISELESEVQRLRSTYSFQLGLLLTESFVRKPWLLPLLPFRLVIMSINHALKKPQREPSQNWIEARRIDPDCLMLIVMHNQSLKHIGTIANIWLSKTDSKVIILTSNNNYVKLSNNRCFVYHLPDAQDDDKLSRRSWNISCDNLLSTTLELHRPVAIAFDGTYPYRGIIDAINRWPQISSTWLKSQDSISSGDLTEKTSVFDNVTTVPKNLLQIGKKKAKKPSTNHKFLLYQLSDNNQIIVASLLAKIGNYGGTNVELISSKEGNITHQELVKLKIWSGEVNEIVEAGFSGVITSCNSTQLDELTSNGIFTIYLSDDSGYPDVTQNIMNYSMQGGVCLIREPDVLELEEIFHTICEDELGTITHISKRNQLIRFLVPNGLESIEQDLSKIPFDELKILIRKQYNEKKWSDALFYVETFIQNKPNNLWGLEMRAKILINQKSWYNSIPAWERICRIDPDNKQAYMQISRAYLNIGNYPLSLMSCIRALEVSPSNPEVQTVLNNIFNELDVVLVECEDDVKRIIKNHNIKPHLKLLLFRLVGYSEDALNICESELKKDPNNLNFIEHHIDLLLNTGKEDESLLAKANYLERFSNDVDEMKTALNRLSKSGHSTAALSLAEKVISLNPDDRLSRLDCAKMLIVENPTKSLEHLNQIESDNVVLKLKIQALRNAGNPEEADLLFEEYSGDNLPIHFEGVRISWARGNLVSTIERANTILSINPKHFGASKFKADALIRLGLNDDYRNHLLEFSKAHPYRVEPLKYRIELCYNEDNDMLGCIELANQILDIDENHVQAQYVKSISLARIGDINSAFELLKTLEEKYSNDLEYFCVKSIVQRISGDDLESLTSINAIMALSDLKPLKIDWNQKGPFLGKLESRDEVKYSNRECLVSVIMTTYGRNELTKIAVNSILNQSYTNLELIIVDDCSPDDNYEFLKQLAQDDSRIIVLQTGKNGGTYLAKNLGMRESKGQFITFMDSDDWTHPDRIKMQVSVLENNPELMAISHSYFRVNEMGEIIFRGNGSILIAYITTMIRSKEVIECVGYFDSIRVSADAEYIGRIKAVFGKAAFKHDKTISLIAMHHNSSLTGGGLFQTDWRGSCGIRFEHYSSFKNWHLRIRHLEENGLIENPQKQRPFSVPKEMIAP